MIYNIKTVPQQDNELLKLENENKKIKIIICDPKKKKVKECLVKKYLFL